MADAAHALAFSEHLHASRSPVLHEEAGLRYLNAADVPARAITRLLTECFAREPMALALGTTAKALQPLVERFLPECTSNGLSAVAVPVDDPGTVAGAFLSRDFKSPLPEGLLDEFPWFAPIGQALGTVGEAYAARNPGLGACEAADLWMVGTDRRFAKRGIAQRLFRVCADLARECGFRRCVTECTGRFSQAAAERAGFTEVARLAYRDFRFEGRPLFASITLVHPHLAFYEKML
jgi:GNAT superfamily N-acetyltransferase